MALRTLNQAQSAYIYFALSAGYFLDFMPQQGRSASIKLPLKNMVSIFRSARGLETVWLQLAMDTECYLRVQLVCKNGVNRMFDLKFEEVRRGFTRLSTTTHRLHACRPRHTPRPSTQVSSMFIVYSKKDCSTRICAQAAADTYARCLRAVRAGASSTRSWHVRPPGASVLCALATHAILRAVRTGAQGSSPPRAGRTAYRATSQADTAAANLVRVGERLALSLALSLNPIPNPNTNPRRRGLAAAELPRQLPQRYHA